MSQRKHPNAFLSISPLLLRPGVPDLFLNCSPDRILLESDAADVARVEEGCWQVVKALALERDTWVADGPTASTEEGNATPDQDVPPARASRLGLEALAGGEAEAVAQLEANWTRWMAD